MYQPIPLENNDMAGMPSPVPICALLLDDSSFDRARIRRLSRKAEMSIQLDEVGSIEELDDAVSNERYDLILIDYRLPVGDGMQALNRILQAPKNKDAGKIMITGDAAVDTAVRAMRGGCHDFLSKSNMNADLLNQAMRNAMTLARERMMTQADYHCDMIRQGLVAALTDDTVTENVVSLVKKQLLATLPDRSGLLHEMNVADVDALLSSFTDDDEFVFH